MPLVHWSAMSKRSVLWIAFVVVHLGVAILGFTYPNQPMGDVYNVYEPWSGAFFHDGLFPVRDAYSGIVHDSYFGYVGIDTGWVYPQLAILPMLASWLFAWAGGYTIGWAVVVTLLDAAAFAVLIGRGRSNGRNAGAWFWLAFIALLGPVYVYRLEAVTVALSVAGILWLARRPWLGSALLAVATWIKVWPAALVGAALIALHRRWVVAASAAIVTVLVVVLVAAAGGGQYVFGFVGDQTTRSLQIESPVSSIYLWMYYVGVPTSGIGWDPNLLTFYVTGPGVDPVISVMTPLLGVGVLAVAGVGAWKKYRGATFGGLLPSLSLGLVLAFIVLNKVGSPQYIAWIVPPLVYGLVLDRGRWWKPATLALLIALATQIVYPLVYFNILIVDLGPLLVLTIRNILLVVLFVWTIVLLVRVPVHPQIAARRDHRVPPAPVTAD